MHTPEPNNNGPFASLFNNPPQERPEQNRAPDSVLSEPVEDILEMIQEMPPVNPGHDDEEDDIEDDDLPEEDMPMILPNEPDMDKAAKKSAPKKAKKAPVKKAKPAKKAAKKSPAKKGKGKKVTKPKAKKVAKATKKTAKKAKQSAKSRSAAKPKKKSQTVRGKTAKKKVTIKLGKKARRPMPKNKRPVKGRGNKRTYKGVAAGKKSAGRGKRRR